MISILSRVQMSRKMTLSAPFMKVGHFRVDKESVDEIRKSRVCSIARKKHLAVVRCKFFE